jgi:DNA-directed RNA polymerase subunit M
MFCPRCGFILKLKKQGKKRVMSCSCGYVSKDPSAKITEHLVKPEERLGAVEEKMTHLPKTRVLCPKCNHNHAYFWTLQTRSADEAETKFFKCEKCGHTWREYD